MITATTMLLWSKILQKDEKAMALTAILWVLSVFMALATDFSIISFLNQ